MADILIADDDIQIAALIQDSLEDEGLTTAVVHDGQAVLEKLRTEQYRLILLDIMMPKMDGLEVCRKIRDTTSCPILFVTAKGRTLDAVVGLEMGADDYIKKPFVVEELVAKVKAHIRRDQRSRAEPGEEDVSVLGDLRIYAENYEVFRGNTRVELSTREFQLLLYLLKNKGKVLTREQIFDGVWGLDYTDIGTVTVTIRNLRGKLDPDSQMIKTVWGVGYKLVEPIETLPEDVDL